MREENDFAWRSTTRGLMHGCGHDGHTTMLLGAATVPRRDAALRRHRGASSSSRPRRASAARGDDRGRPVRAASLRRGLRACTMAEPGAGKFAMQPGADDGRGRLLRHPHHRQRRARRAPEPRSTRSRRRAHRHRAAEHRVAQRRPLETAVSVGRASRAAMRYNVIPQTGRARPARCAPSPRGTEPDRDAHASRRQRYG